MANSDKNIVITPNKGLSGDPQIEFRGFDNTPVTLKVLPDGTLSFESAAGQLFAIPPSLTQVTVGAGGLSTTGSVSASNLSGTNTGDQTITLTGDVTGAGTGSFAATLATVNSNTGSFGSAAVVPVVTVNAKGLVTAVSTANITAAAIGAQPSGSYATLDGGGKVPTSQLPALAITTTSVVASEAAMIGLTAQEGDVAVRTDVSKTFIRLATNLGTAADWQEILAPTGGVTSVNGQTGVVSLTKSDVGLGNVDNTSDANKPVSSATQTALNLKANLSGATFTGQVITPVPTTSIASINIPHGTAPTSPANGDMWSTTANLFYRLNGTTRTIAHTGSSITGSAATLTTGRTIGMTGDVTWTSASFNGSANVTGTSTIGNGAVTLSKMANLAANSIIGNNTGSAATPVALTAAQIISLLGLGNVENKSSATIRGEITSSNVTTALGYTPATSGHTHDYLPLAGGTVTGRIRFTDGNGLEFPTVSNAVGASIYSDAAASKLQIRLDRGTTTRIDLDPSNIQLFTNGTERLRVDSSGVFSVYGDLNTKDVSMGGDCVVRGGGAKIRFVTTSSETYIQSGLDLTSGSVAPLSFGGIYGTPIWAKFADNGNFGIGITPASKLDVNGTVRTRAGEGIRMTADGSYISFYNTAGDTRRGYLQHDGSGILLNNDVGGGQLRLGNTNSLTVNGNFVYHAGNFTPSDYLAKTGGTVGELSVQQNSGGKLNVISASGSSTRTGYIEFRLTDNTRLGYIGYADATSINIQAENGAYYNFTGGTPRIGNVNIATVNDVATKADASHTHDYVPRGHLGGYSIADADLADNEGVSFKYLTSGGANKPTGTDHALMTLSYGSTFSVQMAGDWRTNEWYVRNQSSGSWGSWQKLWHAGNDGSGSGLDADLLDGLQATNFVQTSGDQTISGTKTFSQSIYMAAGQSVYSGAGVVVRNDFGNLQFWNSANTTRRAIIQHAGSNLNIITDVGGFTVNNQTVWHAGNDGAGSGLDADTIDGVQGNRIPFAEDGSNYGTNNTFVTDGGVGANALRRTQFFRDNNNQFAAMGVHIQHATSVNYAVQIGVSGYGSSISGGGIQYRSLNNGTWEATRTVLDDGTATQTKAGFLVSNLGFKVGSNDVWHAGNDGSGSGLDADLLDGLQGSQFLRSDTSVGNSNVLLSAVNGNGIRFWGGNLSYAIWMAQATDGTYGGRVTGETTSDYNMYFRMTGGTNRGFVFQNSSTNVAGIDASGNFRNTGNITASGTITGTSDKRYKEDIETLTNALQAVCAMRGVKFTHTATSDKFKSSGVIAQELREIAPELVIENGDGVLSVAYGNLAGYFIEATKEMANRLDFIEKKLGLK